jgi:ATP-dependent Clp protease adaptor protein ClpS
MTSIFESLELEDVLVEEKVLVESHKLIVYNDDVNTFDWVIQSLVKVCKHDQIQAEQCTLLIHYKGKAVVKTGMKAKLLPMKNSLLDRGIGCVIED